MYRPRKPGLIEIVSPCSCNVGSIQGEGVSNVTYRNIQLNNTLLGGGRIKARHWVDEWVIVENVSVLSVFVQMFMRAPLCWNSL
jgi:hypothetical protein